MLMGKNLGFLEFCGDIRGVILSPARRFSLVQERGALWGSLMLLIAPAYFGLGWIGGIYFDRDPFPGYSFLAPAVLAAILVLLNVYLIHLVARLFQKQGSYRQLLTVFGYTDVPAIAALLLAALLFFSLPSELGSFVQGFRALSISILIALGLALFIWNLILTVLAMRTVYPMRDLKIVAAFVLGSILSAAPALATMFIAQEVRVDLAYFRPIIAERMLRFFTVESVPNSPREVRIKMHVDLLRYRFRQPLRIELIAFAPSESYLRGRQGGEGKVVVGRNSWFSRHSEERMVGRIVGLPGDQVEVSAGRVLVNGRQLDEPYILSGGGSTASLAARLLAPSQYLVLPEDRALIPSSPAEWAVDRDQIIGRLITNRWPLGWLLYRPTVFLRPQDSAR